MGKLLPHPNYTNGEMSMKRTMRTGFVMNRIILANIAFDSLLLVSITAHFANPCCRRTESSSCMPIFTLDILCPLNFLYHCAWLFGFSALCIIAFPFPLDVQVLFSCFQSAYSIAAKPVITIPLEHAAALLLHMGLNVLSYLLLLLLNKSPHFLMI